MEYKIRCLDTKNSNKEKQPMTIYFFVAYPYYFPHFIPISKYCEKNQIEYKYILSKKQNSDNMISICKENNLPYSFSEEELFCKNVDFVFFANVYENIDRVQAKTCFLEHGIGTKSNSFYSFIKEVDIYFVEGEQKYNRLLALYPDCRNKIKKVGFSKFDDVFNLSLDDKKYLFDKYNLDVNKKTILYAPTFFPSSIEKMSDDFPCDFKDYNIIVKPHYLSFERKKYRNQLKKFAVWEKHKNCAIMPLSEYSLVPFLSLCDVMISDESSAMFEFASLNKPVISNRFFKLRWSYYIFPKKLKKRIDTSKDSYRKMFHSANSYNETKQMTLECLKNPNQFEGLRKEFSLQICGNIDGKVSQRMIEILKKEYKNINDKSF